MEKTKKKTIEQSGIRKGIELASILFSQGVDPFYVRERFSNRNSNPSSIRSTITPIVILSLFDGVFVVLLFRYRKSAKMTRLL